MPRILRTILALEANPRVGEPLVAQLSGYRQLVAGHRTWRIVYRIASFDRVEVCEVWAIGLGKRGEVYREASRRVPGLAPGKPELVPLAKVIERLGRIAAGGTPGDSPSPPEPVPQWLYLRLISTGAFRREEVAALNAEEAFEAWNRYLLRGKGQ